MQYEITEVGELVRAAGNCKIDTLFIEKVKYLQEKAEPENCKVQIHFKK